MFTILIVNPKCTLCSGPVNVHHEHTYNIPVASPIWGGMRLSLAEERIASASIKGLRYVAGTPKDGDREEPMERQASRRDLLLTSLTAALPFGIRARRPVRLIPSRQLLSRRMRSNGRRCHPFLQEASIPAR